jgi:hypothetical protein
MSQVSARDIVEFPGSRGQLHRFSVPVQATSRILQLDALSTTKQLKPITFAVQDFKSDVEKVVVTAYADALAGAYNYNKEDGCIAWVNAGGCIWTEGHPDEQIYCADCSAGALSEGSVDSIDAIAEAGTFRIYTTTWNIRELNLCIPWLACHFLEIACFECCCNVNSRL